MRTLTLSVKHSQVQSHRSKILSDGVPIGLDGAVIVGCLGTPGQTKVSGDRQRETTHEICCLVAESTDTQQILSTDSEEIQYKISTKSAEVSRQSAGIKSTESE